MSDSLAALLQDTEALTGRVRQAFESAHGTVDEPSLRALLDGLESARSAACLRGVKCGGCQRWKPGKAFAAWGVCEVDKQDKSYWHESSSCADYVPDEGA